MTVSIVALSTPSSTHHSHHSSIPHHIGCLTSPSCQHASPLFSPPSSTSSTSFSSSPPCPSTPYSSDSTLRRTTPGRFIKEYYHLRGGKRYCQLCEQDFSQKTGNDGLKYHMTHQHVAFSAEMGIPPPSFEQKRPPAVLPTERVEGVG